MDDNFDINNEEQLIAFHEVEGICRRHIEEGNRPYDEEEFEKIWKWIEETRVNLLLLNMVLEGKLDIVFDYEKMKELEEGELLFTLTKSAREEVEAMGQTPASPDMAIDKDSFVQGFMSDIGFDNDGEETEH